MFSCCSSAVVPAACPGTAPAYLFSSLVNETQRSPRDTPPQCSGNANRISAGAGRPSKNPTTVTRAGPGLPSPARDNLGKKKKATKKKKEIGQKHAKRPRDAEKTAWEKGTGPSPSFPPAPALHPRAHPLKIRRLGLVAESEIGLRFSERTFCGAAKQWCQKGPVITGPKTSQKCFRGAPSHTTSWRLPLMARQLPWGWGQTERHPRDDCVSL